MIKQVSKQTQALTINPSRSAESFPIMLHSPAALQKLINMCMIHGKKSKSHLILSKTLNRLANYGDVIPLLMNAIENVKPLLEVKKVRISGATKFVPAIVSKNRQESKAIRWICEAANKRRNRRAGTQSLDECLFLEIVDAYNKRGSVRKRRDDLHKLAEANRGFSHYRWW